MNASLTQPWNKWTFSNQPSTLKRAAAVFSRTTPLLATFCCLATNDWCFLTIANFILPWAHCTAATSFMCTKYTQVSANTLFWISTTRLWKFGQVTLFFKQAFLQLGAPRRLTTGQQNQTFNYVMYLLRSNFQPYSREDRFASIHQKVLFSSVGGSFFNMRCKYSVPYDYLRKFQFALKSKRRRLDNILFSWQNLLPFLEICQLSWLIALSLHFDRTARPMSLSGLCFSQQVLVCDNVLEWAETSTARWAASMTSDGGWWRW